uniref:Uncharacterized protein n=1 Tax=Oryza brachyantha TaxID=4533 RepID=J3L5N6_ORYBR
MSRAPQSTLPCKSSQKTAKFWGHPCSQVNTEYLVPLRMMPICPCLLGGKKQQKQEGKIKSQGKSIIVGFEPTTFRFGI